MNQMMHTWNLGGMGDIRDHLGTVERNLEMPRNVTSK
jgi:hypothetical protein